MMAAVCLASNQVEAPTMSKTLNSRPKVLDIDNGALFKRER